MESAVNLLDSRLFRILVGPGWLNFMDYDDTFSEGEEYIKELAELREATKRGREGRWASGEERQGQLCLWSRW